MVNGVVALIVDESKWLTISLGVALLAVTVTIARHRRTMSQGPLALSAMSLFFALTVGTMAFGHLLAVSVKLAVGTLEGSATVFYLIGVALAVPSWWLVVRSTQMLTEAGPGQSVTVRLNAWIVVTLLAMGFQNLPLAAPGLIAIAYAVQSRRVAGWFLISAFVVINLVLFAGSVIFFASGQSFEQFQGIE